MSSVVNLHEASILRIPFYAPVGKRALADCSIIGGISGPVTKYDSTPVCDRKQVAKMPAATVVPETVVRLIFKPVARTADAQFSTDVCV
jgi:hypothetical protein